MKHVIITAITLAIGVGTAAFFLMRSSKRKTHKPIMTFKELYEDNLCLEDNPCSENELFD